MGIDAASKEKQGHKVRRIVVGFILAIVAIVVLLPFTVTVPVSFCKRCHQMKPYFTSWKKSTHSKVKIGCQSCHVKPHLFSENIYRLNTYSWIIGQVTEKAIRPIGVVSASTEACRRCHSLNRKVSTSGDLKINHEEHIVEAKLECPKCHSGVIHPGVKGLGEMNPPRKLCKECHEKEMKKCPYCHVINGKDKLEEFNH